MWLSSSLFNGKSEGCSVCVCVCVCVCVHVYSWYEKKVEETGRDSTKCTTKCTVDEKENMVFVPTRASRKITKNTAAAYIMFIARILFNIILVSL